MPQSLRDSKANPQTIKRMISIISILLTALPLILILGFGSYTTVRYFVFGTVALLLGVLNVKVWATQAGSLRHLFSKLLTYGLLVYLAAFALVSLTGINPTLSFFSTLQRTDGFFALFFLTLFTFSVYTAISAGGAQTVRRFLKASLWGAVLLCLLIDVSPDGLSWFTGGFFIKSRGGATIGNSSLAALYVVWHVFFASWLMFSAQAGKARRWSVTALVILLSSPLFISWHPGSNPDGSGLTSLIGSARGAVVGIFVGALIALGSWLAADQKKSRTYIGKGLLVAVIAGLCITGVLLLQKTSSLHQAFDQVVGENRFLFWDSAVAGFQERPIVGWGPGTFSEVYHRHFDPAILAPGAAHETLVDRSHNIFFESLSGGGLVLTLSLIFYFACLVLALVRFMKRDRLLGSFLLGAFSAWFFQCQFVFDSISSLAMLAVVSAIALTAGEAEGRERPRSGAQGGVTVSLASIAAIAIFVYAIALPMWKAGRMYSVYEMKLPARANQWQTLSGISPMGDNYDSVLIFSSLKDVYLAQVNEIKAADPARKAVYLKELDSVIVYIKGLGASGGEAYDLLALVARLEQIRLTIDQAGASGMREDVIRIINHLLELSPTDERPRQLQMLLPK